MGLDSALDQAIGADVLNAIARVTGGNFRLVQRLFSQIERVLTINGLASVTTEVVDAASETLVIGGVCPRVLDQPSPAEVESVEHATLPAGSDRPLRPTRFRPWPEARAFVYALGLGSFAAWRQWATSPARPADIPSNPDRAYARAGWTDWADWLGTEPPRGGRPADRGAGRPLALG